LIGHIELDLKMADDNKLDLVDEQKKPVQEVFQDDDGSNDSISRLMPELVPVEQKEDEPLLIENKQRYVMFPIKHEDIWAFYKFHVAVQWVSEEVDLQHDVKGASGWESLNSNERHFIAHVLAFFAASDGIVAENLAERFLKEVQIPELRAFYSFQLAMEQCHSETYSLLIDTYIKDENEKMRLFRAVETIPCIKRKAEWAIKWISSSKSFAERLVAFAIVEGIFFCGSFCAIFWLKTKAKMPGLCFSNELISRDESLHCDLACLLYRKYIKNKLSQSRIEEILREAIDIEKEFVCDALPVSLLGMNKTEMSTYIEFVSDRLLVALEHKKIFNAKNPFQFMEMISLTGKTNFFEKKVSEYSKSGVAKSTTEGEKNHQFSLSEDF
jgi:ribonucleotide reductase beta subunit family protein with ferritin-like domain